MFEALFSESELSEAQIIQSKQEQMFIFRDSDSPNFIIISLNVRFDRNKSLFALRFTHSENIGGKWRTDVLIKLK